MKRKILIAIYIILMLLALKLIYNNIANSILINNYNKGEYSESQAKSLTYLNFTQSYIANYNYGNILYKNGEYEKAIEEYKKSLDGIVPKEKECNIRINYALAICKTVKVDETNQESIEEAIKEYESAIDILTENGCANKDNNNGHSENAEKLKNDIQKEIDRLKDLQEVQQNNSEDEEREDENKTEEETETIKNKIQNIKEDAIQEQREKEKTYENINKNYDSTEKNW